MKIEVKTKCPKCGDEKVFNLDEDKYNRFKFGREHVQDVFPNLNADDRERLLTGMCPKCWDIVMAEPDEEEYDEPLEFEAEDFKTKNDSFVEKPVQNYIQVMKLDEYMTGHKGFIAGGCFKNIFVNENIKDVDIFFENEKDRIEAEEYFSKNENFHIDYQNDKVKAFRHKKYNTLVELINTVYGTPEQILSNFDFTIAKFAYFKKEEINENNESITTYKVLYHKEFFEHLLLKRIVIDDKLPFPVSTFERMIRYTGYGFYPCRETKKKIIDAIHGLSEVPDVSMALYKGWD